MGSIGREDAHDPTVADADTKIHKQVQETAVQARAVHAHVNLHVTDWMAAQQEDLILITVIEWISTQKEQDLKHLMGDDANTEEGVAIFWDKRCSCSTKVPSITTIYQPESWKK